MEICLKDGAVLGIDAGQEQFALKCLDGLLWITREGDCRDYFLRSSERMTFARRESVVIEAWGVTTLHLDRGQHRKGEALASSWHIVPVR